MFEDVIILKTNYRIKAVKGDKKEQEFFERQLRLGDTECTPEEDYPYWKQYEHTQNTARREQFKKDPNTVFLVSTNDDADEINAEFVRDFANDNDQSIFAWAAHNSNATAARANHNTVWGLRSFLGVCVGAPVLLLANLHQEAGLANSTRGIVRDVVFAPTFNNKKGNMFDLPLFVIIEFPGYSGPPFPHFDNPKWVPIPVMSARVNNRGSSTRRQIPIVLARALTHWKAQGQSLEQVYAYLCIKRHVYGLDFVAISRAMSRNGLMLDKVEQDLFTRIKNSRKAQQVRAERKRLEEDAEKTKTWTLSLLKLFSQFYKTRHKRKNLFQSRTASVDVSFDILSTIHESDTWRYTGDTLASVVGEHTMTQLVNNAWRSQMHKRNYQKTKYFQILASQPGRLGKRKRYVKKVVTATKAAYQFAVFSHRKREKNDDALKKILKLPKAQIQKFVIDELELTDERVRYENPTRNPFTFKRKTLLASFKETLKDHPYEHENKKVLDMQIEYARRTNVERLTYVPPKKARKSQQ